MRDRYLFQVKNFDSVKFSETLKLLKEAPWRGVAPSLSMGVYDLRKPNIFLIENAGEPFSYYDISSVTKILVMATLTALLVERKWISWETQVSSVFPSFQYKGIGFHHLLAHVAGYASHRNFFEILEKKYSPKSLTSISFKERQAMMRELIFAEVPETSPGERVLYSDIGPMLLGFCIEEILQMPIDEAAHRFVFEPMQLNDPFFHRILRSSQKDKNKKVAPTELSVWRGGMLQGQVHDDNTWAMGGVSAHAGVFSTVFDLLLFSERLWNGFLSRETLGRMWRRITPHGERTLGWDTPSSLRSLLGTKFSRNSVGHWGFTGTSLWMDLDQGVAVSLLTNRVCPSRDNILIRDFRRKFHDTLRVELGDS